MASKAPGKRKRGDQTSESERKPGKKKTNAESAKSLTQLQRRGLGDALCDDEALCGARVLDLHAAMPHDSGLVDEEIDDLQTFEEFVQMGKVGKANSEGTGRFKVTKTRRVLKIMRLAYFEDQAHLETLDRVCAETAQLFEAYFLGCKVERARALPLEVAKQEVSIVDKERSLAFPLRSVSLDSGKRALDVFSIMDVINEYMTAKTFAIIVLTDAPIADPETPDAEILGRATGDRVAVVHCCEAVYPSPRRRKPPTVLARSLIAATAVHEAMHTMGLDHCIAWRCNMNAYIPSTDDEDDTPHGKSPSGHALGANNLTLCPLDLAKLRLALGLDLDARFALLARICRAFSKTSSAPEDSVFWARHASWYEARLACSKSHSTESER